MNEVQVLDSVNTLLYGVIGNTKDSGSFVLGSNPNIAIFYAVVM